MVVNKITEKVIKSKQFKGDILITDPCYICKKEDESTRPKWEDYFTYKNMTEYPDYNGHYYSEQFEKENEKYNKVYQAWLDENNDWRKCDCGFNCECLGIQNYMVNSTLYGDWSCTTYNKDTKETIGEFCADSGLVSVFLLDEVRAYNSDIDNWIKEHSWCATIIKDFDGIVNFIHVHTEGVYDYTTKYWKKGDPCSDDILIVEGEGNINFTTRQTGL